MNVRLLLASAAAALALASCGGKTSTTEEPQAHLSDYVTTLVGTLTDGSFSTGNTYPAIAVPWGMNFWTPMTAPEDNARWPYVYGAHQISKFKMIHQPSVWIGDYGEFTFMPYTGEEASPSWFSHESETAKPYYYKVYLADHDLTVEIAPTERAAVVRVTFPESDASGMNINACQGGSLSFDGDKIEGWSVQNYGGVPDNFKSWFVARCDTPFTISGQSGETVDLRFKTSRRQQVTFYLASSFISADQALRNLGEVSGRSFDEVKDAAQASWDDALGRIRVEGGTVDQYRTFYSCLYRSLLFPRKFYEIDPEGKPYHYSPFNGKVEPGYLYTDTGFWDTFRALLPLLNFVYPETSAEIQAGLANISRENEFIPEWASPGHRGCMIGNNSASVIADAAVQGVYTDKEGLESMYKALVYGTEHYLPTANSSGRYGCEYYNSLGYIPYDVGINENVARTLEYAYADWCLARLAELLGKPQEEIDKWTKRSENWRNVFDPETDLMRGRNADGSFQSPFSPYKWGDAYTEGNAWHYTWSVFHNVPGLVEVMGGERKFTQMLDSVFLVPPIYDDSYYGVRIHEITEMQVADMGNYAHGNQPAQHMLYLYDWTKEPWKGQGHIREVMDRLYKATPDGYCGDEDTGQTSAWYVYSALGFYPVCPASGEYAVGSPLFKKATVSFPDGKKLVIDANGDVAHTPYVKDVTLNGKKLDKLFLDIASLKKGGTLTFSMSSEH